VRVSRTCESYEIDAEVEGTKIILFEKKIDSNDILFPFIYLHRFSLSCSD